jgi:hypothetical protein
MSMHRSNQHAVKRGKLLARVTFACSDAEEKQLVRRAKAARLSVSQFIRKQLNDLGVLVNQLDSQ